MSKIRVGHLLAKLNTGGIETWLKDVVCNYDKQKFQMDFILTTPGEGFYDEIIKKNESHIYIIDISHKLKFYYNFYNFLKKEKFDIIHSHLHFFSGITLLIAYLAGVKIRISHSHNDTSGLQNRISLKSLYFALMSKLITIFSTKKLACSIDAGKSLFGNSNFDLYFCGVDLEKFKKISENYSDFNTKFRKDFGIPNNAKIIGHVGRFEKQKNHHFILKIFKEVVKKDPDCYLVLIGDGRLIHEIKELSVSLGIDNKIIFLGMRNDVENFMKYVFNLLLFPSLYEGLGLILIEAQASGLKCIISDVIPQEATVIQSCVEKISLNQDAETWSNVILKSFNTNKKLSYTEINSVIDNCPFSINFSVIELQKIYLNA